MKSYFVLAECKANDDQTSFIVSESTIGNAFAMAQRELKRRVEEAKLSAICKYVIVKFERVE